MFALTSFWLSLGIALVVADLFMGTGYLALIGSAALVDAGLAYLIPGLGAVPLLLFFLLLLSLVVFGLYSWLQRRGSLRGLDSNGRAKSLEGITAHLLEDTDEGYSRIIVADASWRVHSAVALPRNALVRVVGIDGVTLKVVPVSDEASC